MTRLLLTNRTVQIGFTGYSLETAITSVLLLSPRCLSVEFVELAPNRESFSNSAASSLGLTEEYDACRNVELRYS
jgi:hypothetical protein